MTDDKDNDNDNDDDAWSCVCNILRHRTRGFGGIRGEEREDIPLLSFSAKGH